jgi:ribonuclease HI
MSIPTGVALGTLAMAVGPQSLIPLGYVAVKLSLRITVWKCKQLFTASRNVWKTASGLAVKNIDLWKKMIKLSKKFLILDWKWVKAHNGNPMNEAVDTLARKVAGCL